MNESPLVHLDLRAPLEYAAAPDLKPFASLPLMYENAQELLFCFALNQEQAARIDPDHDRFLAELICAGRGNVPQGKVFLPAGLYLFAQQRSILNREGCIRMAIEQQKDGLWERNRLGNCLYVRYLFEDGSPVTQIFRPCDTE